MERAAVHSQTRCIFPGFFTASLLRIHWMRAECKAASMRLLSGCCFCWAQVSAGACSLFQLFLHFSFLHINKEFTGKRKEQSLNIMALRVSGKCTHRQFHKTSYILAGSREAQPAVPSEVPRGSGSPWRTSLSGDVMERAGLDLGTKCFGSQQLHSQGPWGKVRAWLMYLQ